MWLEAKLRANTTLKWIVFPYNGMFWSAFLHLKRICQKIADFNLLINCTLPFLNDLQLYLIIVHHLSHELASGFTESAKKTNFLLQKSSPYQALYFLNC